MALQSDPHTQLRALYSTLLQNEEYFHEFKRMLQLYDFQLDQVTSEPEKATLVREALNGKIRSWVAVPFDGISASQMLQWRAIVVEERFNVALSPWKESNSY